MWGYASAPGFFSKGLIDHIHNKVDATFRNMSHPPGQSASSETAIELEDPLVRVSEVLDIAFHESVLKVVAHFYRHIPPVYRVGIVRYLPGGGAQPCKFRQDSHDSDSLEILIDLVPVDRTRGPLVYIPGSHLYAGFRPHLMNALGLQVEPRRLDDHEVERLCARNKWATLTGDKGSITAVCRRGLSKGPFWIQPADNNQPRTSIRIEMTGHKPDVHYGWAGNRMHKWNFERMSRFQQAFTHPCFVEEQLLA
ncbi:MAG: hypothetical protein ABSF78_12165 [Candidatus Acidiferrales bacterium]|jgi:hypothetical protein